MKKKNTTEMEFDTIEELVEMGIQVGMILECDRMVITAYLRLIFKNGYFLDATDVRFDNEELRVPLTLKALPGLLRQREKEIETAKKKYEKNLTVEFAYNMEKLNFLISEISKEISIGKEILFDAIKKRDFFALYQRNEEVKNVIPLVKTCITKGQNEWYLASANSINIKIDDLTRHLKPWAKTLKNEIK